MCFQPPALCGEPSSGHQEVDLAVAEVLAWREALGWNVAKEGVIGPNGHRTGAPTARAVRSANHLCRSSVESLNGGDQVKSGRTR